MGHFQDSSVKDIIYELNDSFFLPDIQREYVWLNKRKEKKIEQLFDSILRGYPIGSFLFWKIKKDDIETDKNTENTDKINFQLYKFIEDYDERDTHNKKINIDKIRAHLLSIVLDGQQRLTSLYLGLIGSITMKKPKARWDNPNAFEQKKLYLNLRYKPDSNNPDDNYQFEFKTPNNIEDADKDTFWYKVGDILELDSVITYIQENNLGSDEAKILEKLQNAFCREKIISYFDENEKNLDKVLKIFIRVNSGGTKLSYSDLLMSIITANFSSDIRELMNFVVDEMENLGFGVMKRDPILKTCLIMTGSNHIFQLRNFSKTNINKIEENWEKIIDSIYKATQILSELGYKNKLSSAYILSALSVYLYHHGYKINEKEEYLNFVRTAQITSYFSNSLDNKLEIVKKTITNCKSFEEFNKLMRNSKSSPLRISSDDIENLINISYGDYAVLPALQILYPSVNYSNMSYHIDHIYPKSKFNFKNERLPEGYISCENLLFNLQLISSEQNLSKGNKSPEKWLDDNYSEEEIRQFKKQNFIDPTFQLLWENMDEFYHMRNQKIIDTLKNKLL